MHEWNHFHVPILNTSFDKDFRVLLAGPALRINSFKFLERETDVLLKARKVTAFGG